jgi:outer membrane protein assembly factor BamA
MISGIDPSVFERKHFAGVQAGYILRNVNEELLPTKGIDFQILASYTRNLQESTRSFMRYASSLSLYLPLGTKFSFATRAGAATNDGETEFYQLNKLGGSTNLRGYRHQRFYGKTMFYNNNELRWITPSRNFFFNGRAGFLAFFDNGRVWQPEESSKLWHTGVGGGIILVPFNKLVITAVYAHSQENNLIDARLGIFF